MDISAKMAGRSALKCHSIRFRRNTHYDYESKKAGQFQLNIQYQKDKTQQ